MPTPNNPLTESRGRGTRDNSSSDPLGSIKPLDGRLVPLKTKQELCAAEETGTDPCPHFPLAYVVELPLKSANEAVKYVVYPSLLSYALRSRLICYNTQLTDQLTHLSVLKTLLPPHDPEQPLHHLRRFVKTPFLPPHLRPSPDSASNYTNTTTIHLLIPALSASISSETITTFLAPLSTLPLNLRYTLIPLTLPKSAEQAQELTSKYWPCVYNPASHSASYAPPPFLLSETLSQIEDRAGWYLALADVLGAEAAGSSRGRAVGAVIVDVDAAENPGGDGIVAVAGDARWWPGSATSSPPPPNSTSNEAGVLQDGRPDHHAVMRAISLIAQLRIAHTHPHLHSPTTSPILPLTRLEHQIFSSGSNPLADDISTSTYLCTNLSIYVSHEPCTCCAMAILHSRFRNVAFRRRMPGTGALTAETTVEAESSGKEYLDAADNVKETGEGKRDRVIEGQTRKREGYREEGAERPGLGYGLFWRKELNWRVLGWEFLSDSTDAGEDDKCEGIFNA